MNLAGRLVIAVMLVLAAGPIAADEARPEELLRAMQHSLRHLDYQGFFVYQNGSRLDTMQVIHGAGEIESERLVSLSGPRSEVIRQGAVITFVKADLPATQLPPTMAGSRLIPLVPEFSRLENNAAYRLRVGATDRVAGNETVGLDIIPLDHFRYGYRLWLGTVNHLPLRVALFGSEPRPLEQMVFISLSTGDVADRSVFNLGGAAKDAVTTSAPPVVTGPLRWVVSEPPTGYVLLSRHAGPSGDDGSEQLVYGDGLATVSVYIEPSDEPVEDDVAMNRGAMNVYMHRVPGWRYTSVGNVPAATVQQMALAVRPAAPLPNHR